MPELQFKQTSLELASLTSENMPGWQGSTQLKKSMGAIALMNCRISLKRNCSSMRRTFRSGNEVRARRPGAAQAKVLAAAAVAEAAKSNRQKKSMRQP